MSILDDIVAHKKKELNEKKGMSVIAEIKRKSPSAGDLSGGQDLIAKAKEYESAGADALSVVTDQKYFGGSLKLFQDIRKVTTLPMLMKDFIIHPRQVDEAEQASADALLIIAAIRNHFHPELLSTLSKSSLTPVFEVATMEELTLPFVQSASVIGVNARDLNTFEIDIDRACTIIKKISKDTTVIAFSGVKSAADVQKYRKAGAQAVLVGESLMKANDVASVIHSLKYEY